MTLRELKQLVTKWQERLNLRDWVLTVKLGTCKEYEESGANATCTPDLSYKTADIMVVNQKLLVEKNRQDDEYLVVHELLHLHHAFFKNESETLEESLEENAVHALATLLIALDRKDEKILGRKLSRIAAINPPKPRRKIEKTVALAVPGDVPDTVIDAALTEPTL